MRIRLCGTKRGVSRLTVDGLVFSESDNKGALELDGNDAFNGRECWIVGVLDCWG